MSSHSQRLYQPRSLCTSKYNSTVTSVEEGPWALLKIVRESSFYNAIHSPIIPILSSLSNKELCFETYFEIHVKYVSSRNDSKKIKKFIYIFKNSIKK